MKFNLNNFKFGLPLLFPLIAVLTATFLHGDGMNTLSFCYLCVLWISILMDRKIIFFKDIGVFMAAVFIALLSVIREGRNTNYFSIQFAAVLVSFLLFSERYFSIRKFGNFCLKHYKFFILCSIGIYVFLLYSFNKYGLYYESTWATGVFRGPFNLPHTLAYILFFLTLIDLYYFLRLKSVVAIGLAGINAVIILATAVRSVLVPFFFVGIYLLLEVKKEKSSKLTLLMGGAIVLGLLVLMTTGVLQRVIDKSLFALVNGGDITNSRGIIFTSSIEAFFNGQNNFMHNHLVGIGMDQLLDYNLNALGVAIHAHNDIIDAITAYGIVGFFSYLAGFVSFTKKKWKWETVSLSAMVLFNGLFMYGEAIPLLVFFRLFFESGETNMAGGNTIERIGLL